ncbi:hypothetical protein MYOV003v1_p0041 [Vibrio phage 207E48.1]|nr:hypothetical protein MYOV003v1_p0041 [Vibrio phage 207E48.1]
MATSTLCNVILQMILAERCSFPIIVHHATSTYASIEMLVTDNTCGMVNVPVLGNIKFNNGVYDYDRVYEQLNLLLRNARNNKSRRFR